MKIINFKLKSLLTGFCIVLTGVIFAQTRLQQTKIDPEKYKIISSGRPDGRYVSTRGFVQYFMRNQKPQLAFNPQFSKDEFTKWQTTVRVKLQELMKFPVVPPRPQPKFISKVKRDSYTVEKWEIYPQLGSIVPFLMLVPDSVSAENPVPAVLCLPGTSSSKESLAGEDELHPIYEVKRFADKNRMAMFYAQQGIIAVAVDNPGFAETSDLEKYTGKGNFDYGTFTQYLLNMGWHYMGLSVFQNHQILQWMRTRDFINPDRIAISGHSLGGWSAPYLAVLNPDISAVVMNQCIYRWLDASKRTKPDSTGLRPTAFGLCYVVPGMFKWFDNPDIIASLAPRPLLCSEGGTQTDIDLIQRAFQIMDAKDNMAVFHFAKYRNPETRYYDYLPEGLDNNEFLKYINTDPTDHYFKADVAVPWLKNILMKHP